MRVLVTGSSGHLGEALVRVLRDDPAVEVVGLDLLPSPWTDVVGPVQDRAVVRSAVRGGASGCADPPAATFTATPSVTSEVRT